MIFFFIHIFGLLLVILKGLIVILLGLLVLVLILVGIILFFRRGCFGLFRLWIVVIKQIQKILISIRVLFFAFLYENRIKLNVEESLVKDGETNDLSL